MELQEYWYILKKRLLLIVSVSLILPVLAGLVSVFIISKTYKSDISVIIGKPETTATDTSGTNYNDLMMYQKLVQTYSQIAQSRTVADDVIAKLKLDIKTEDLLKTISVAPKGDTEFMTISVTSKNPEEAAKIANQWALSLKEVSQKIKGSDNVQMVDNALVPTSPASPRLLLNVAIAFVLGLMLSVGIAFLLDYLDNTIKSEEDIEKLLNLTVLGSIPDLKIAE